MSSGKYPAKEHTRKAIAELLKLLPDTSGQHGIFLQASPTTFKNDTDREYVFRQESNFNYLTGCLVESASLFVTFTSASDFTHQLFIPPNEAADLMWSVGRPTLEEVKERYESDAYRSSADLEEVISGFTGQLYTLPITVNFPPLPSVVNTALSASKVSHNADNLYRALHIARLTKTEYEIDILREANRIGSNSHEVLMRELGRNAAKRSTSAVHANGATTKGRTGKELVPEWEIESEGDAEAVFLAACRRMGAQPSYSPICASGRKASTLHYVCNDRLFPSTSSPRRPGDTSFRPPQLGRGCCGALPHGDHGQDPTDDSSLHLHDDAFEPQVLLIDAGCEWMGYASDITRTSPIGNGGKFTEKAGEIYDLVLRMQKECEAITKAGTHWDDIHLHAHKVLIETFLKIGIFKDADMDSLLKSGLSCAFYPHGLGHSIGLDVHDSLQYLRQFHSDIPDASKSVSPSIFAYLRIRQPLLENMVLTIEPGCYFPPRLMEDHGVWTSEYVDQARLKEYIGVGGVRIEDSVVVRKEGCENLTLAVRDRKEVERLCSGQ